MGKTISSKFHRMRAEDLKRQVELSKRKAEFKIPPFVVKQFDIDELHEEGRLCYRLVPKQGFNGTYIMYLYSSKLCFRMNHAEWMFLAKTALACHAGIFLPMYPLAPEHCCREVFQMLEPAYANCTKGQDVERVVLMGCGAGGGLALSLAMAAWREGLRKPDQLYLLSPMMDTEFFDKSLEQELIENSKHAKWTFYNEHVKEFLNSYWVRDYAVKTEYTSPYYGDMTDICDDVVLFSGVQDLYHCYAREFYKKAKKAGVNIRFFEFEDEAEDFMIYDKTKEYKKAQGFLIDCINGTFDTSLRAIYPLKMMSDWSKKYPEYFKDDWASKFIYDHKFDFTRLNPHISEYQNIRMAADASACDTLVRRFTEEFPCGTVVHMACRLDNMFGRVDNGRIQWYSVDSHNIMSVRRAMYGVREREKTIGRRLMDFSWLDEIRCKQNQGVMFVCDDGFSYLNKNEVRDLIAKIRALFPGSHLVFTASSTLANATANTWKHSQTVQKRKKRKFSVNNAAQMFGAWRPDYRIIDEQPIFRYLEIPKKLGWVTKLMCRYNLIGYNHRIIHVKLGSEEYKINYKY
ncbi:hypothetical protein DW920_06860 [Clostridium sp. AM42-36]|nr:hypothetical protein DW920_06860 [Clostridium sp. AM42-36]